jgi:hypothetical protein
LRLQPRKDLRRRVLLLTATPVNNSLEDLRQQAALMFGKPLFFNDTSRPTRAARARSDVEERVAKATKGKGAADGRRCLFTATPRLFPTRPTPRRRNLAQVPAWATTCEQEKRLTAQQAPCAPPSRAASLPEAPARIAGERSIASSSALRALCKQIEREWTNARLLFRPDAPRPRSCSRGRLRRHSRRARALPPAVRDRGMPPTRTRPSLSPHVDR